MEAHFVHYNAKYRDFKEAVAKADGLFVVAVFIQALGQQKCPLFSKITDKLPNIVEPMAKCSLDSGELRLFYDISLILSHFSLLVDRSDDSLFFK